MKTLTSKFSTLAMLAVLSQGLLVSGCATRGSLVAQQAEQQASEHSIISQVSEAIATTEARMAKAQADNTEMFAPSHMDEAMQALSDARRYSERFQQDPSSVNDSISLFFGDSMGEKALSLISQANDALTRAEENKRVADEIFAASNENFTWLKKFKAQVYFRYEYDNLERTQRYLVGYVADGRLEAARQGMPRFLSEQKALEALAAQRFYLYEITQRVEREGRYTLDRYAALSYGGAVGALNKAKAVIAQDTRNEAAILQAKAQAEFAFEVAHAVAADMQKLLDMDRQEMERWLILLAAKLNEVGQSMGANDVRNHSLFKQLELLTEAAKQNSYQPAGLSERVAATDAKPVNEPSDATVAVSAETTVDPVAQRMQKLADKYSQRTSLKILTSTPHPCILISSSLFESWANNPTTYSPRH